MLPNGTQAIIKSPLICRIEIAWVPLMGTIKFVCIGGIRKGKQYVEFDLTVFIIIIIIMNMNMTAKIISLNRMQRTH